MGNCLETAPEIVARIPRLMSLSGDIFLSILALSSPGHFVTARKSSYMSLNNVENIHRFHFQFENHVFYLAWPTGPNQTKPNQTKPERVFSGTNIFRLNH